MRQELGCSECGRRLVFDMDFGQDGNHEITCPACGHVHYRVVRNGQITGDRWYAGMQTLTVTNVVVYSSGSGTGCDTWNVNMASGTATQFVRWSWLQTGTGG